MTERKRWLLGLDFCVAAMVPVLVYLCWPLETCCPVQTAINRTNCERIEIGMTLAEVEAILGGPMRDESTGPLAGIDDVWAPFVLGGTDWRNVHKWLTSGPTKIDRSYKWLSDEGMIMVWFRFEPEPIYVCDKRFVDVWREPGRSMPPPD